MQDRNNSKQEVIILSLLGIIPVIWIGLYIAPAIHGGLMEILPALSRWVEKPFDIQLCEDSLKTVLILLLIYGITIGAVISSMRNYRRGEENGSAKWGDKFKVNKKYHQKPEKLNISVGIVKIFVLVFR